MDYQSAYIQAKQQLLQVGEAYCEARKKYLDLRLQDPTVWEDRLYAEFKVEKYYKAFKRAEEQLLHWAKKYVHAESHRHHREKETLDRDLSRLSNRLLAIDIALRVKAPEDVSEEIAREGKEYGTMLRGSRRHRQDLLCAGNR